MGLTIYSEQELKEIQKIEKDVLSAIIDVCKQLQIEFFVIGGTTLGAIRHEGFIPWDDDIDIGMTRQNYMRFIKEAPSLFPDKYCIQDPYSNQRTAYPYTKVRVEGTAFVEYSNRNVDMHHGVYVDIFPFDEVPDDEKLNIKQFKIAQRLSHLFVWRQSPDMYSAPNNITQYVKAFLRRIIFHCLRLVPYTFLLNSLDNVMTHYNGTGQSAVACLLFPRRKCEYGLKTTLFPLKSHLFEGMLVPVPNDYNTYLVTHYGDWKKLPPLEQRYGHKPYYINLHESYN